MSIIDITLPLYNGMAVWPGGKFRHAWARRIGGAQKSNDSIIETDVHAGTHVDAPLHFINRGESVESMDLDVLCGPAYVADLRGKRSIGEAELESARIPKGTKRLLIKTDNSRIWQGRARNKFKKDFVALTGCGAERLVKKGIKLVGMDYLSVAPFADGRPVHLALLGAGVVVLEGVNLSTVTKGKYELICLPLKINGADGALARAILRRGGK
jgi:arylformamidase